MRGSGMLALCAVMLAMGAAPLSGQPGAAAPAPTISAGQVARGELTGSDVQLPSGKIRDLYVLRGQRGERIALDLHSEDFDSYLLVEGPDGFARSNDDAASGGNMLDSRVVIQLPADGAYRISVTSFRPGEMGAYELRASVPPREAALTEDAQATPIRLGASVRGRLTTSDDALPGGARADHYRFTARRGQRVRIDLSADKFDTYLVLRHPDGSIDENDDLRDENGALSLDSRIDRVLAEDGEYLITVTSYRANATGEYRLTVAPSPGLPRQEAVPGGARVIALLVGVADYAGRVNDLPNTDDDARRLFEALRGEGLLHPASALLVNGRATRKGLESAFARAAAAAGPDDLFLFFFSGHGNQVDAPDSAEELDGRRETIELYDGAITDAQLAQLFQRIRARMSMVVLDSCFSGGFRNLIDRPNVMGLFSSEEDLTSLVASRLKAGGFLAYFLREGLTGAADTDGDRLVTAGELGDYVRRRFRREGEIPVETRENERGIQNLLVERGGVHVDDVVVRLAEGERRAGASGATPR